MRKKIRNNVGVLGLGIVGSRIAATLRSKGHQVYVWSRTPKPEPNFMGSPGEIAGLCQVIQLFVTDGFAVMQCIEDMGPRLTGEHVICCHATIGREATLEAAERAKAYGAQFLDAPFTGSKNAAAQGALCYYIGGDETAYKRAEPILRDSSKAMVKAGKIGDAATLKVATNMIVASTGQILAEAFALVKKSGINPTMLASAMEHHAARSVFVDMKLPGMIAGNYEPHFSLKHMFKDVQIALQMANDAGLHVPATATAAAVLYNGIVQGWGEEDFTCIAKLSVPLDEKQPEPELPVVPATSEAPAEAKPEVAVAVDAKTEQPSSPAAEPDQPKEQAAETNASEPDLPPGAAAEVEAEAAKPATVGMWRSFFGKTKTP